MGFDTVLNLEDDKVIRAVLILLTLLSTGLTIIILFFNSYIITLDPIKLILFSITFSTPNFLSCYLLIVYFEYLKKGKEKVYALGLWLMLSIIIFYVHIFIFFALSLTGLYEINFFNYWLSYLLFLVILAIQEKIRS
jgi:hypothetical protein